MNLFLRRGSLFHSSRAVGWGMLGLWTILASGMSSAAEKQPRVVFNDDAQMLSEAPAQGATAFVKAWLDKEIQSVPFTTYVFLAATPDMEELEIVVSSQGTRNIRKAPHDGT